WALYIAPSHWGRGYGSALLRNAEEALAAGGRRDLALWVLEGNDRARRFYERAGWRTDDGTKPFGDTGFAAARSRKQVWAAPDRPIYRRGHGQNRSRLTLRSCSCSEVAKRSQAACRLTPRA